MIYINTKMTSAKYSMLNGFSSVTLSALTAIAILCGVLVIVIKNPIISVLFLIGLFISVSLYLMLLGLDFIGLSYILVYVGAISILFLFILMLINIRISEIITLTSNSIPLAIMLGILFISTISPALPSNLNFLGFDYAYYFISSEKDRHAIDVSKGLEKLNNVISYDKTSFLNSPLVNTQSWDSMIANSPYINTLGNVLYTSYPLWIILTSLVLLLAMVGCILISMK